MPTLRLMLLATVGLAISGCAFAPTPAVERMAASPIAPQVVALVVAQARPKPPVGETYVWDLTDLYPTPAAWDAGYSDVQTRIKGLESYRGTLGKSPAALLKAMQTFSSVSQAASRLYAYASLKNDEDQRVTDSQERFGRAQSLMQQLQQATSWSSPEILKVGATKIRSFIKAEKGLAPFAFGLEETLRQAPHTLDDFGEKLMADVSLALGQPSEIYALYANTSIPWPTVKLSDGTEVKLNQAGYSRWRQAPNRADRKIVFDAFWGTWKLYENGMGATLNAQVLADVFQSKARKFDSVLAKNMFDDALPPEIYTQLVTQVNASLPSFHRYLKLRGKFLGVTDLRYYDIYPPLVEADMGAFDLKRSEEVTFAALKPFGEEYLGLLRDGLSKKWMHSHPQEGKETGAYMAGYVYDAHPYVLLNHNEDYESASTFAHEWGHAIHTLLAKQKNGPETAGYSTFIAEMASTINEILLQEYMIANATTKKEKLYYLGQSLDLVRGTFFRQAMFGEFELAIHEAAERNEPLTGAKMTEIYGGLLRKYHGEAEGVMTIDDVYTTEWAFIPHFYREFYVYQYATSVSGAAWFAEQFLSGDTKVRDNFLEVLRAGGSDHPADILSKKAGLDMTKPDAYQAVVRRMNNIMDRIEALEATPG